MIIADNKKEYTGYLKSLGTYKNAVPTFGIAGL